MNLSINIFHLARIPEKKDEVIDIPMTLREERARLADKIWALKRDSDFGSGGHTAGWNAAIDAAVRMIVGGQKKDC